MTIDRAIGLLKMAVPMKAVTMAEFNDFIDALEKMREDEHDTDGSNQTL